MDLAGASDTPVRHGVRNQEQSAAFAQLVHEHADMLFAVACRLGSRDSADDLVQETFTKAWRNMARFRGDASARTWLYRILVNASRDRFRRESRAKRTPLRVHPPRDPSQRAQQGDLVRRVLGELSALPERQREALLLRARAGFSYAEISEVMGVTIGSVKAHLVAARKSLAERVGKDVAAYGRKPA